MNRLVALAAVGLAGCSFAFSRVPTDTPPRERLSCSAGPPTADGLLSAGLIVATAMYLAAGRQSDDFGTQFDNGLNAGLAAAGAMPFVASALFGVVQVRRCREFDRERLISEQVADRTAAARREARDRANALTKQAAIAARSGNCAEVRDLARSVRVLDADFYDLVFARDLAIDHCTNWP